MRLAELFVTSIGALAGLHHAAGARASLPANTHRLVDLPIRDICNQGGAWMAPERIDRQVQELPAAFLDVEVRFENCLHRISSRQLPDERSTALCLLDVAAATCADGDDAWCANALQRSAAAVISRAGREFAASAEPGPVPTASDRSLDQLRADIHPEFTGTWRYQEVMQGLKITFMDLTGLDIDALASPLRVEDVVQLLGDADMDSDGVAGVGKSTMERFDVAAKAAGVRLGALLTSIAEDVIHARPEHYRSALGAQVVAWTGRHYPSDPAVPLTSHQRRHIIGLLVELINAQIPTGSSHAAA